MLDDQQAYSESEPCEDMSADDIHSLSLDHGPINILMLRATPMHRILMLMMMPKKPSTQDFGKLSTSIMHDWKIWMVRIAALASGRCEFISILIATISFTWISRWVEEAVRKDGDMFPAFNISAATTGEDIEESWADTRNWIFSMLYTSMFIIKTAQLFMIKTGSAAPAMILL